MDIGGSVKPAVARYRNNFYGVLIEPHRLPPARYRLDLAIVPVRVPNGWQDEGTKASINRKPRHWCKKFRNYANSRNIKIGRWE